MLKRWEHESSWEQDVHLASSTYPSKRVSKKMLLHLFIITMMMYVSLNHSQCQPPSHTPRACRAHRSQCYWSDDKRCTFNTVAQAPWDFLLLGQIRDWWFRVRFLLDHLVVQRTTFSERSSQGSSLTWRFLVVETLHIYKIAGSWNLS